MTSNPNLRRRQLLLDAVTAGLFCTTAVAQEQAKPRVIRVTARKFRFTPNRIVLKKGEPVVLEFQTHDVPMGFNAPAFKVRTNILPDTPAQVAFTPDTAGKFDFFCDVSCGNGHEKMAGIIVVG